MHVETLLDMELKYQMLLQSQSIAQAHQCLQVKHETLIVIIE